MAGGRPLSERSIWLGPGVTVTVHLCRVEVGFVMGQVDPFAFFVGDGGVDDASRVRVEDVA